MAKAGAGSGEPGAGSRHPEPENPCSKCHWAPSAEKTIFNRKWFYKFLIYRQLKI